ncbi:MAG: hypothetical protein MR378_10885 [Ruminococcus sp.]|nr:hypothetical protein [Ruminococcus sp.]
MMDINTSTGMDTDISGTETTTTIVDSVSNLSNTSGKFPIIIGILVVIAALLVGSVFVIKNVKKKTAKQASHNNVPLSKKDAHEIMDLLKALDELNRSN